MDFAALKVGSTVRHITWPTDYIRIDAPAPMPSPNQGKADALLAQFTRNNLAVPADVQALVDNLLSVRYPEPAWRPNRFVLVTLSGESELTPTPNMLLDTGFVLRDGGYVEPLTEEQQKAALEAAKASYSSASV